MFNQKIKTLVKKVSLLTSACMIAVGINASQIPVPYPSDERIKMVAYQENNVIPVYGKTFTSTQLIFGKDEKVLDVEGGDTDGWLVTHHQHLANMLFIKPKILGSNSNMVVVSNKHNYYFHVMSNTILKADERGQTYAIKFVYPIEERAKLNQRLKRQKGQKQANLNIKRAPHQYNWNYTFSGNHQVMPLHVFDDGTFTFFEMRKNQDAPAIFAVDNHSGKEAVVNIRRQGEYLVVQRIAPQFTLRSGKEAVASVFNKKEISKLKGRG
jgi:type IV secretion system protein VirB9